MKTTFLKIFSTIILANMLMLATAPVIASDVRDLIDDELDPIAEVYDTEGDVDTGTFGEVVARIIKIALGLLGVIFIALIIYAGFIWMTSTGNEEQISKAKKIMVSSIIGVVIILAAYIITVFVIDSLLDATGASN